MRLLVFFLLVAHVSFSQFSKADSLRGGYGETRNWWDLTHYDLIYYTESWAKCEDQIACKLVLQLMETEKGIFLGEFV